MLPSMCLFVPLKMFDRNSQKMGPTAVVASCPVAQLTYAQRISKSLALCPEELSDCILEGAGNTLKLKDQMMTFFLGRVCNI